MIVDHNYSRYKCFVFDFINRARELKELQAQRARGGLLVVYGRRRVGKTRLLTHWLRGHRGAYSQAIEGLPAMQLEQVYRDLKADGLILRGELAPKSWVELFELLSFETGKTSVCLDEFPYLVAADPALPSVVQRFVDHKMPKGMTLVLAGSSLRMMHDMFLHRAAPLYGRASKLLPISPMNYLAFAEACGLRAAQRDTFAKFAIVGGIPKYWEFVEPKRTAVDLAETLFFGFAPYFNEEPARLLRDEGIAGIGPGVEADRGAGPVDRPFALDLVVQRARAVAQADHDRPAALAADDIGIGLALLLEQVADDLGQALCALAEDALGGADEVVLVIGGGARG